MNEIYVKGLEGAFLVVLNLIDELDCKSGECKQLRDKIRQYYTWILERRVDKIRTMLESYG
ncbi:MAG: hypothetical protein DRN04_18595 [Thermoprotei archaeon]|nr:MAG: hypothetical protein DRN04_18595 [Thermoprotei archaeon]